MQHSLSEQLQQIADKAEKEPVTLRDFIEAFDEQSYGLLLMILALPSALPIPAPGYSTPFGIVLMILAVQMLFLREQPWFPAKLLNKSLEPATTQRLVKVSRPFLTKIEKLVKPRLSWLSHPKALLLLGALIFIMAALMILPIPFTNTLPALVIFLVGCGLTEKDGMITLVASAIGILAVFVYLGIIYILITQGPETLENAKEYIKSLF